jgi:hypothetical protein
MSSGLLCPAACQGCYYENLDGTTQNSDISMINIQQEPLFLYKAKCLSCDVFQGT